MCIVVLVFEVRGVAIQTPKDDQEGIFGVRGFAVHSWGLERF